ncbi:MAG: acyl carrier protein [Acidimicrobiia bacterium]|nr:acyl carrier protein [Acidimicrobiia bacterium]MCL4291509.1 acyl carrier protein [Acidimicrobiia bacterium]
MSREEILATLRDLAAEVLGADPSSITEDARLAEDLDADSLDLVEMVMALEDHYGIEIPEDDLEGVTTVGQTIDVVVARVA